MINSFKKYICSNCKGKCEKTIVITKREDIVEIKCYDYIPNRSKIQGYEKKLQRTAKQRRSLMGFKQEF